jgi:hypothetical protein
MNEPEPIDLSPLDPEVDAQRWSLIVESTRLRVAAVLHGRQADPLAVLSGWARPILAAAAAVLLLLGAATVAFGDPDRPAVSEARRLAYLTESSVLRGRGPTGAELLAAIDRREGR